MADQMRQSSRDQMSDQFARTVVSPGLEAMRGDSGHQGGQTDSGASRIQIATSPRRGGEAE